MVESERSRVRGREVRGREDKGQVERSMVRGWRSRGQGSQAICPEVGVSVIRGRKVLGQRLEVEWSRVRG